MNYRYLATKFPYLNPRQSFVLKYYDFTGELTNQIINYVNQNMPLLNANSYQGFHCNSQDPNVDHDVAMAQMSEMYNHLRNSVLNKALHHKTVWPCRIQIPHIRTWRHQGYHYAALHFNTINFFLPNGRYPLLYEKNKRIDEPCAVAIGPVIKTDPYIANYRSANNHLRGMIKRVAHQPTYVPDPLDSSQIHPQFRQSFKSFVEKFVKKYEPLPHIEMSHELLDAEWLNNAKHYNLHQKSQFHELLDRFMNADLKTVAKFRNYQHGDLYACKSFIKREFYSEDKEPRIINSRSDTFKAVVAPYIKMIEHATIYNQHFIKGTHPTERAHRMQEIADKYRFVAESDYSSFEGSFSQDIMSICEWALFRHMLSNNPIIKEILKPIYCKEFKNTCIFGTSRTDYCTFEGSRMSGDMWTSLANGFTNMMLFLYCAHKSHTLIGEDFDFIVEGDDGFFGYNYNIDFSPVTDLGFQLKIKKGADINELSFCGTCLGPNETPVPDFWRTIDKFGWSFEDHIITRYGDKTSKPEDELLYAKALSLLAESQGIPILQPLAMQVLTNIRTRRLAKRYITYYEEEILQLSEFQIKTSPITEEMRQFFAERFKVTIKQQKKIESIIQSQRSVRFVVPLVRPKNL